MPIRIRLDLAYDGTAFAGWAKQPGQRTVQGVLEESLALILRLPDTPTITVAGRTDVGVHARAQVAHVDLDEERWHRLDNLRSRGGIEESIGQKLVRRLRGVLGPAADVVVHSAVVAPEGFDARFSAEWRRYEYRLADAFARRDPLARTTTTWSDAALDVEAMDAAAKELLGLHDFAAFCRARAGATTIRTLLDFDWRRDDDGVLVGHVRADAFCHSMVRALVGACASAGEGRIDTARVAAVRDGARRTNDFTVMAARGLSLMEVRYPPDDALLARSTLTRAKRSLPVGDGPDDE